MDEEWVKGIRDAILDIHVELGATQRIMETVVERLEATTESLEDLEAKLNRTLREMRSGGFVDDEEC